MPRLWVCSQSSSSISSTSQSSAAQTKQAGCGSTWSCVIICFTFIFHRPCFAVTRAHTGLPGPVTNAYDWPKAWKANGKSPDSGAGHRSEEMLGFHLISLCVNSHWRKKMEADLISVTWRHVQQPVGFHDWWSLAVDYGDKQHYRSRLTRRMSFRSTGLSGYDVMPKCGRHSLPCLSSRLHHETCWSGDPTAPRCVTQK